MLLQRCIHPAYSCPRVTKKSNLCYTRFWVSRVSGAQTAALRQDSHIKVAAVASRWQRVGDLIGSELEPRTSRTRSRRLITLCQLAGNHVLQEV